MATFVLKFVAKSFQTTPQSGRTDYPCRKSERPRRNDSGLVRSRSLFRAFGSVCPWSLSTNKVYAGKGRDKIASTAYKCGTSAYKSPRLKGMFQDLVVTFVIVM